MKSALRRSYSSQDIDYLDLDSIQTPREILVTGTDTGIGKTFVVCQIIKRLRAESQKVLAVKPVETGCELIEEELLGSDIQSIATALGISRESGEYKELYLKLFRSPVAPAVADSFESGRLAWADIVSFIERSKEKAVSGHLLVEGAGGLLVPLLKGKTFAELALETNLSALVVFGSRLGAINQAALTFEVLRSRGIPVCGYVYNECYLSDPVATEFLPESSTEVTSAAESNRELLAEIASSYQIKEIGYFSHQRSL